LTSTSLTPTNALGTAYGGTGLTSFTANGVVYASSTSALATGSALVFTGTNLGIGTSSPNATLNVYGGNAIIENTTSAYVRVQEDSTGNNNRAVLLANSTGMNLIADYSTNSIPMIFNTANAERMRLDASGNLGLGITPYSGASVYPSIFFGYSNQSCVGAQGAVFGLWTSLYYNGGFKYSTTGNAGAYFAVREGYFQWASTGSTTGTAGGAASPSTYMTLDNSGNLGIGTTSPSAKISIQDSVQLLGTFNSTNASAGYIRFQSSGTNFGYIGSGASLSTANATDFTLRTENSITFATAGGTERARIDSSGQLLVGLTSAYSTSCFQGYQTSAGNWVLAAKSTASAGSTYFITFNTSEGTQRGYIYYNGVATVYSTSSDERLKENIVDSPSAVNDVNAIKIRSFDWKENKQHQKYGVVAQELQAIAPEAISTPPEKDGMLGVDYSLLVPMLIKSVQELSAKVTALEAKLGV